MQKKLIPSKLRYRSIELSSYVQLRRMSAGLYFWAAGSKKTLLPAGYEDLSEMVESLAVDELKNEHSRFTFRLFFLQHGTRSLDRESMEPIFQTTCSLRRTVYDAGHTKVPRKAIVISRDVDEDFVDCVANNGCDRCLPAD